MIYNYACEICGQEFISENTVIHYSVRFDINHFEINEFSTGFFPSCQYHYEKICGSCKSKLVTSINETIENLRNNNKGD